MRLSVDAVNVPAVVDVKRNGLTEPFSRDKVIVGVKRACQGRDVSEDALKRLAQTVEESVRSHGGSQVHANDIGLAILDPLRELDEVAYLRFASVYKSFESAEDFESEIRMMRRQSRMAARSPEAHRSRR